MKYGIDYGHNCPPDSGASGIRFEDNMTKDVGTRVIAKLKALGHQVITCTPSSASSVTSSLAQRCDTANSNNVDIYISIHFNAFNESAHGTEIFAVSTTGQKLAKSVLDNIVALGYYNRGVKDGSSLYVLRNTNMPAILIECAFCDSQEDMNRYTPEPMANAIVKGLTGQLPPTGGSTGGSTGVTATPDANILKLQKALNRLKITDNNSKALVEDGFTGPATRAAKQKFQSIVKSSPSDISDPETWTIINQIFAKPILRPNHAGGPVVNYLQFRLGAGVDGVYGPNTTSAVQKFQKQNGLTADGIIGPQSWTKLIG